MVEIEKGVPVPVEEKPFAGFARSKSKYPFAEMEVGDSVFYEGESNGGKVHASMVKSGQRHGRVFTSRKVDGGLRIWRIA